MAATSAVHYGVDSASQSRNLPSAQGGDAHAQFKLGKAYCCSAPGQINPAKSTEKATFWLCKAAAQHDGDAEYLLGRIYMGDVRGQGLVSLAAGGVASKKTAPSIARAWLQLAAEQGVKGAADKLSKLKTSSPGAGAASMANGSMAQSVPCLWSDVFPKTPT